MNSISLAPTSFADSAKDASRSRLFIHATLISCLILQRFGLILGGGAIFASLPLFVLLLGWALVTGIGTIRPHAAALYLAFAAWTLIVTLAAVTAPDARFGNSTASLFAVLLTYAMVAIGPSARFDRGAVLELFAFYARIIAAAGIVQWLVQFAGIRVFSFLLTVPPLRPVLVEPLFNYNPILHYGSTILRSNGFFLLEPSVLSQVLSLAIVVDYFILGRVKFLPLYLVSYLLSFSGTGALALALAIPFYAALSARNMKRVAGIGIAGVVALGLGVLAFPEQVGSFLNRSTEVSESGSSGYARFIGPYLPIARLSDDARLLVGWGPGATERYVYHVEDTGSSIAKLIIDYGVIGILIFTAMFVGALWRREFAILSVVAVATFLLGGGYLVFAPMLVLLFLLCIWSGPSGPDLPGGMKNVRLSAG